MSRMFSSKRAPTHSLPSLCQVARAVALRAARAARRAAKAFWSPSLLAPRPVEVAQAARVLSRRGRAGTLTRVGAGPTAAKGPERAATAGTGAPRPLRTKGRGLTDSWHDASRISLPLLLLSHRQAEGVPQASEPCASAQPANSQCDVHVEARPRRGGGFPALLSRASTHRRCLLRAVSHRRELLV